MQQDEYFMRMALAEAQKAVRKDEVPVGAVIVHQGKIIARAHNLRETRRKPTAHAELLAIERAARRVKGWRLLDCTLYVTLEPCAMCAGAIVNARLSRVCFGAYDPKAGAMGSVYNLNEGRLNHTCICEGGLLADECGMVLTNYFREKRKKK